MRLEKLPHVRIEKKKRATVGENGSVSTICSVCRTVVEKKIIHAPTAVKVAKASYTYDGKAKKAAVTVVDSVGNPLSSSSYEVAYEDHKSVGQATVTVSQPSVSGTAVQTSAALQSAEDKKTASLKPMPRKRVISAEEEEREKAKSLAMLQKNSMIDYRYNRKGDLVKTMLEGSEASLVSDVFSVIALVNRRMADDIRPLLLDMLPYYHSNDFDMEYQLTVNKETTIRYVVNESGLITACTVNGAKYPLCLTILMIFRQLAEDAEDGMDAFHERIMNRMKADMEKEKKLC